MPSRQLRFIVDGSLAIQQRKKTDFADEGSKAPCPYSYESAPCLPLICYQSDAEIEQLLGWLKDNDVRERAVKDAILHWRKSRLQDQKDLDLDEQEQIEPIPDHLSTMAAVYLERQFGLRRCECLEPVWSSRCHCATCHKTFITEIDLEAHNEGKCLKVESFLGKKDVSSKVGYPDGSSKLVKYQNENLRCPHDLEVISSTFITRDSNKELVQQIGLIGSNGVPSFFPCKSPLVDAMLISQDGMAPPSEDHLAVKIPSLERRSMLDWIDSVSGRPNVEKSRNKNANRGSDEKEGEWSRDVVGGGCCVVPLSSLKPVRGKASKIWRMLKINMLDMEAAVSVEAFRPSKSSFKRRCWWRSFVKSAQTIYEIIQATIVLEDMIKTEYLRNEWWYWSSWSAAAKTSTLSALSLRIYSLDSALLYDKNQSNIVVADPSDPSKPDPTQDQRTESVSDTNTVEKPKPPRKSSRKRKDPEG